ncbi:MAG: hypothetical protein KAW17_12745, partial [Candidatus Eisenbacteria sp.]|nr:hypothetical protein [Candidatus Eisenbacteria bacterium]
MSSTLRVNLGWIRVLAVLVLVLAVNTCSDNPVRPALEPPQQPVWFWQNPLPQGNSLSDVCFTDANTGTAVGAIGTILRTTDGGAT